MESGSREWLLLGSVFIVAVAGLVYELIAGTLTAYLMGSSVFAFSLVIGLFLSAMGLGAWLAQYVRTDLIGAFIRAETALAAIGGSSALLLFAAFSLMSDGYQVILGMICLSCGVLVGIEIPLLLRIIEARVDLRVAASHVLALDYAGALLGSLAFPLLLLPHLGLVRSAALLGLLNLAVAVITAGYLGRLRWSRSGSFVLVAVVLSAILATGGQATSWLEDRLYTDPVLLSRNTPYQRIVVTRWRDDVRLYVEGHLQFSSRDEYRYHESLVHPAMSTATNPRSVLILGGGDGMAAREALSHPGVERIDLVDLDPEVTRLFQAHPLLVPLNDGALQSDRVHIHNEDAVKFLESARRTWDVIVMDLPDPNDAGLARLYSVSTFRLAGQRLSAGGALVTQATSPFYAPEAFWCVVETMKVGLTGLEVSPYHANVPSFGEWGFVMASRNAPGALAGGVPRRFLTPELYASLFTFPADLAAREVAINRLADGILARYYRDGWRQFQEP